MLNLILGYGMTETSCICHISPIENSQIGSFGQPLSRTQVRVVDVDTGESLGPGQHGEICIKGPQVMKGYYKNEKATKELIDKTNQLQGEVMRDFEIISSNSDVNFEAIISDSIAYNKIQLDSIFQLRLTDFPKINPAIKRGVPVKTEFQLPVVLQKEE